MALSKDSPFPAALTIQAGKDYVLALESLTYGTSAFDDLIFYAHSNTVSICTVTPTPNTDEALTISGVTAGTGRIAITVEDDEADVSAGDPTDETYLIAITVTAAPVPPVIMQQPKVTPQQPLVGDDITGVDFVQGMTEVVAMENYIVTPLADLASITATRLTGAVTGVTDLGAGTVTLTAANAGSYVLRVTFTPKTGQPFIVDIHGRVTDPPTAEDPPATRLGTDIMGVNFVLGTTHVLNLRTHLTDPPYASLVAITPTTLTSAVTGVVDLTAGTLSLTAASASSYVVRLTLTPRTGGQVIVDVHGRVTDPPPPTPPPVLMGNDITGVDFVQYTTRTVTLSTYIDNVADYTTITPTTTAGSVTGDVDAGVLSLTATGIGPYTVALRLSGAPSRPALTVNVSGTVTAPPPPPGITGNPVTGVDFQQGTTHTLNLSTVITNAASYPAVRVTTTSGAVTGTVQTGILSLTATAVGAYALTLVLSGAVGEPIITVALSGTVSAAAPPMAPPNRIGNPITGADFVRGTTHTITLSTYIDNLSNYPTITATTLVSAVTGTVSAGVLSLTAASAGSYVVRLTLTPTTGATLLVDVSGRVSEPPGTPPPSPVLVGDPITGADFVQGTTHTLTLSTYIDNVASYPTITATTTSGPVTGTVSAGVLSLTATATGDYVVALRLSGAVGEPIITVNVSGTVGEPPPPARRVLNDITGINFVTGTSHVLTLTPYLTGITLSTAHTISTRRLSGSISGRVDKDAGTITLTDTGTGAYVLRLSFVLPVGTAIIVDIRGRVTAAGTPPQPTPTRVGDPITDADFVQGTSHVIALRSYISNVASYPTITPTTTSGPVTGTVDVSAGTLTLTATGTGDYVVALRLSGAVGEPILTVNVSGTVSAPAPPPPPPERTNNDITGVDFAIGTPYVLTLTPYLPTIDIPSVGTTSTRTRSGHVRGRLNKRAGTITLTASAVGAYSLRVALVLANDAGTVVFDISGTVSTVRTPPGDPPVTPPPPPTPSPILMGNNITGVNFVRGTSHVLQLSPYIDNLSTYPTITATTTSGPATGSVNVTAGTLTLTASTTGAYTLALRLSGGEGEPTLIINVAGTVTTPTTPPPPPVLVGRNIIGVNFVQGTTHRLTLSPYIDTLSSYPTITPTTTAGPVTGTVSGGVLSLTATGTGAYTMVLRLSGGTLQPLVVNVAGTVTAPGTVPPPPPPVLTGTPITGINFVQGTSFTVDLASYISNLSSYPAIVAVTRSGSVSAVVDVGAGTVRITASGIGAYTVQLTLTRAMGSNLIVTVSGTVTAAPTTPLPPAEDPIVVSVGDDLTGVNFVLGEGRVVMLADYLTTPFASITSITPETLTGAVRGVVDLSARTLTLTAANAGSYIVRLTILTNELRRIVDVHGRVRESTRLLNPELLETITMPAYSTKQVDVRGYDWGSYIDGYTGLAQLRFVNQQDPASLTLVQVDLTEIVSGGFITLRSLAPGQTILRFAVAEQATGAFLVQLRIALAMRDVMGNEPPVGELEPRDPFDAVANIPMEPPPLPVDAPPQTLPPAPNIPSDNRFVMVERVNLVVSRVTIEGGIMTLECEDAGRLRGRREQQVAAQLGRIFSFVGIYEESGISVNWPTEEEEE